MTINSSPTAGAGNTIVNSSGLTSTGSQYVEKTQSAGDPKVASALVTVDTQYFEPSRCGVVDAFDADGRNQLEYVMWGENEDAPVASVKLTPVQARALAAELLGAAAAAEQENDPSLAWPPAPVDLDEWVAGDDSDDDAMVREELNAARLTPGYDYEGEDIDLEEWEPGEEVDEDSLVADELFAYRVLSGTPVDLDAWVMTDNTEFDGGAADQAVADELRALRLSVGSSGSVDLDKWALDVGVYPAVDAAVIQEIRDLRRQRRRNRNAQA